jgi:hypothetical protein
VLHGAIEQSSEMAGTRWSTCCKPAACTLVSRAAADAAGQRCAQMLDNLQAADAWADGDKMANLFPLVKR